MIGKQRAADCGRFMVDALGSLHGATLIKRQSIRLSLDSPTLLDALCESHTINVVISN